MGWSAVRRPLLGPSRSRRAMTISERETRSTFRVAPREE
jgi:hypothetical protein